MCDCPVQIVNPNFLSGRRARNMRNKDPTYVSRLLPFRDYTFRTIYVPCGRCPSCVALKQSYLIQRVQMEEMVNDLYFCTLTYSNKMISSVNVNGYNLLYADVKDIQNMMKRIRNDNLFGSSFRYIAVSEFGSIRHRPHWHLLFSIPGSPDDTLAVKESRAMKFHDIVLSQWVRNYGSKRVPDYRPLCEFKCTARGRNYDFHYVNPASTTNGVSDVSYYVTKYITKSNDYVDRLKSALYYNTPDTDTFTELWNLIRPRMLISKGFGLSSTPDKSVNPFIKDYIKSCLSESLQDNNALFPRYRDIVSGNTYPLSPYYRSRFLTLEQQYDFFYRRTKHYCITDDGATPAPTYDVRAQATKNALDSVKTSIIESRDNYIDSSLDGLFLDDFIPFIEGYDVSIPRKLPDNKDITNNDDFLSVQQLNLFTDES